MRSGKKPRFILGIDPGFTAMGWAVASLNPVKIVAVGVVKTKPSEETKLATEENYERSGELWAGLIDVFNRFEPSAIAFEGHSWPRHPDGEGGTFVNPAVCGKLGIAFGLIFAFVHLWDSPPGSCPPMPQTQQRMKKMAAGRNTATKDEVLAGLLKLKGFEGLEDMLKAAGIPSSYREHPVDAAAAIYAALDTELGRTLRSAA
jgi:Holliday junction resolvasome RuvABC endonuclease subunit